MHVHMVQGTTTRMPRLSWRLCGPILHIIQLRLKSLHIRTGLKSFALKVLVAHLHDLAFSDLNPSSRS